VRTAGDVSLDYALEHVQRAAPKSAKDAGGFLKRIKG
jgi:conjugal transfer pilus assembly protein TrbC